MFVANAMGEHRHYQRPGVAGDADGARWQRRLAPEEGDGDPVLEKVVVGHEAGDLSPPQRADHLPHARR